MPDFLPLLVVGLVFAAGVAVVLALLPAPERPAERLARYGAAALPASPGMRRDLGARQRLLAPMVESVLAAAARTAPDRVRRATATDLVMAGSTMSPTTFLGIRSLLMIGLPLLGGLYLITASPITTTHWLGFGISVIWGRRLPSMWLKRRIRRRQKAIDRRLPYAIDLMVACLEGGLSLDASLAKVAEQSDGPLASEVRRTLQEMALGRAPIDALRDLGSRTGAPELQRFTENVVQAERMGISIAEALRTLARESRVRRRQLAEEMARKAPIKMVPVLIFCVLPALAIVIMTPAVILLVRTIQQAS
jgi:tight adherence protein C